MTTTTNEARAREMLIAEIDPREAEYVRSRESDYTFKVSDREAVRAMLSFATDPAASREAIPDGMLEASARAVHEAMFGYEGHNPDSDPNEEDRVIARAALSVAYTPRQPASAPGWVEMREANYMLRQALIACGRHVGAFLVDDVSTDFLMNVPEEVRLKLSALSQSNVADRMREAGQFLLDRLVDHEVRMTSDADACEWFGHVTPAMARFRAALADQGDAK